MIRQGDDRVTKNTGHFGIKMKLELRKYQMT